MNSYHQEQIDALELVSRYLNGVSASERRELNASPLMYLHNSPGLLRLKQKAGVDQERGCAP